MKYRAEIDGLRAVAVVPVVLFHAGLAGFSGGYVGVDVFFVISGYLITSILLKEREEGSFSLIRFYERRARRILPALLFVMVLCVPFAVLWMTPRQFLDFGRGLVSGSLFSSNLLFWLKTDYFAAATELNPLIHTWSLAVEEQFYVFFPLFLLAIKQQSIRLQVLTLVSLALVSLAASEIMSHLAPAFNFYMLPTRAWELLAGSLCAYSLYYRGPKYSSVGNALGYIGLGLLLVSIVLFDEKTRFPSIITLVPVVGTCLLILTARSEQGVGRLLSSRPFIAIGLTSFSTYLWHQPLLAFARIRSLSEPSEAFMLGLAALAILFGWLTWRFVEQPFRRVPCDRKPVGISLFLNRRSVFTTTVIVGFSALVVLGIFSENTRGFPDRLPPLAAAYYRQQEDINPNRAFCHYSVRPIGPSLPELPMEHCIFGPDEVPSVALLGDSHGDTVAHAFASALSMRGVTSTQITLSGCLPFPDFTREILDCDRGNQAMLKYVLHSNIDTVVIVGRYASVYHRNGFDNGEGGLDPRSVIYDEKTFFFDLSPGASYEEYALELFRRGIATYLDAGLRVILLYPIPEAGWNVPARLVKLTWFGGYSGELTTSRAAYLERYSPVISMFDSIEHPLLERVRPDFILCGEASGRCLNSQGSDALYYDHNHLSQSGAQLLVPAFIEAWEKLGLSQVLE